MRFRLREILIFMLATIAFSWTHTLIVNVNSPDGIPKGKTIDSDDVCAKKHNGLWFATWISKTSPAFHCSDTFYPGDIDWGHGYYNDPGLYITSMDAFKSVGRKSLMQIDIGDTLHIRMAFEKHKKQYFWQIDTVFTENPGSGGGKVVIEANMIDSIPGPLFFGCWD